MDAFNTVRGLVQGGVAAYGVFLIVKGLVTAGGGLSNHQSTELRDGFASIIGGAMIVVGAVIVGTISIG